MADFTQVSKFNKQANFSEVKFGADAPLLETELNELQQIQNEARADIIRDSVPSGFIKLPEIDFSVVKLDTLVLKNEAVAYVNGYKITIPALTEIPTSESPTKDFVSSTGKVGYREDLVFLEVWKEVISDIDEVNKYGAEGEELVTNQIRDSRVGVETSKRVQVKYRLRYADDVDFVAHPDGLGYTSGKSYVTVQGALEAPLISSGEDSSFFALNYGSANRKNTLTEVKKVLPEDMGVFVAHNTGLNVVDDYVYAIPMFKISRRNKDVFSKLNPNGATPYTKKCVNGSNYGFGAKTINTKFEGVSVNAFEVGDEVIFKNTGNASDIFIRTVSEVDKIGYTISFSEGIPKDITNESFTIEIFAGRVDGFYSNILVSRDVTDLAHKISLTGYDYLNLLSENFDKFNRGELQGRGKTKVDKTYVGLKKTPISVNTILYASFDGKATPETSNFDIGVGNTTFLPMPTGLGIKVESEVGAPALIENIINEGTIDFTIDFDSLGFTGNKVGIIDLLSTNGHSALQINIKDTGLVELLLNDMEGQLPGKIKIQSLGETQLCREGMNHIRATWKYGQKIFLYLNGALIGSQDYLQSMLPIAKVTLGTANDSNTIATPFKGIIADLSISNVSRGSVFATLPIDFTLGYARVVPAFNAQRRFFGEPVVAQTTVNIAKATSANVPQLTVTQSVAKKWTVGDTIKVKGLSDDIISGVIDADTALTKFVGSYSSRVSPLVATVLSVDGIAMGDKVRVHKHDGTITSELSVLNVDTSSKSLTLGWEAEGEVNISGGDLVIDTTAIYSVPTVRFMKDGVKTDVPGTWINLGTFEATFTLGVLPLELVDGDIEIQYSTIYKTGQGEIPVYQKTLQGEINGQKLVKSNTIKITDDFARKVVASRVSNPNIFRALTGILPPTIVAPTDPTNEVAQVGYGQVESLNNVNATTATSTDTHSPYQIHSFDLIRMVEDKFGTIPALNKIEWLNANIVNVTFNHYGYGVSLTGNLIEMRAYSNETSTWSGFEGLKHSNPKITKMSGTLQAEQLEEFVDANGFVHMSVFTGATDGITETSVHTDYVNIEIELRNDRINYDTLVPESSRRDAGKAGVLFVRKETRELETMFAELSCNNEVVVYGEYKPKITPLGDIAEEVTILAELPYFIGTDISSVVGEKQGNHVWRNILWTMNLDKLNLLGRMGYTSITVATESKDVNTGAKLFVNGDGFATNYTTQFGIPVMKTPLVGLAGYLVEQKGQIKLLVMARYSDNGVMQMGNTTSDTVVVIVPVDGNPLIKNVEGVLRETNANPTSWKTPLGQLQGYINEDGQAITTYQ